MLPEKQLSLERTEDFETMSKIINDPSIAGEIGICKDYEVEWIDRMSGGIIWLLASIDDRPVGFLWFDPYEGDYLAHIMMLPEGRGINTLKFIDAAASWMFLNTDCKIIWAKPPILKSYVMIKRYGFEYLETRYEECPFTKKVWTRKVCYLTRKRWEGIVNGEIVV